MTTSVPTATRTPTPTDATASPVSLEVRSYADRTDTLTLWSELEQRIGDRGLTCSTDWTEAWLNAYGDLVPHWFLLARDSETNTLRGICLITEGIAQKDGPFSIRTLHVGTAGEPDADSVCVEYNRLLVEPDFEPAFAHLIAAYLEQQPGVDQWNLDGIAEADLAAFQSPENNLQLRVEPAFGFDLTIPRSASSNVLGQFRSATRRKVKRSLETYENLEVDWAASLDDAVDVFGEMIDLHQARWNAAGKPGSYSSPRVTAFHEELLSRLVPQGRMAFVRVRSASGTVGIVQLLIDRHRALLYQCGWNPGSGKQSPGVVVDYLAMEECLKQGLDAYDFLAFATQHKRHLANMSTDIVWAKKQHPRLKFVVVDQARRIRNWLRERKLKPDE